MQIRGYMYVKTLDQMEHKKRFLKTLLTYIIFAHAFNSLYEWDHGEDVFAFKFRFITVMMNEKNNLLHPCRTCKRWRPDISQ